MELPDNPDSLKDVSILVNPSIGSDNLPGEALAATVSQNTLARHREVV